MIAFRGEGFGVSCDVRVDARIPLGFSGGGFAHLEWCQRARLRKAQQERAFDRARLRDLVDGYEQPSVKIEERMEPSVQVHEPAEWITGKAHLDQIAVATREYVNEGLPPRSKAGEWGVEALVGWRCAQWSFGGGA
ncbi:MAG TPA: hypothetical protein VGN46_17950 [Luteibacter sp.]